MKQKDFLNLEALMIPEIRQAFLAAMQTVADSAIINEMVLAIESADLERLMRASGYTPAVLASVLDAIEEAYKRGALMTVADWPKVIPTPTGPAVFRFDMRNPIVEADLKNFSSMWVTQITSEVRETIRTMLNYGMIAGNNPRKTALQIAGVINKATGKREGGAIGLSSNQTKWSTNARTYLETLDKRYLSLKLRDKRFDSVFKRALESGKPLSQQDVGRFMVSYNNRALKYRADVVARTETVQALNRGERIAHDQILNEGLIREDQVTKEWDDTGDGRVRTTHSVLAVKYGPGKDIPLNEAFVSPSGSRLMYPGDHSLGADASEIIHCRCRARYKVDWYGGQ